MTASRKPATNTLLAKLRREAKKLVSEDHTYTDALNDQARSVGYTDWRDLAMANGARNAEEGAEFMFDPVLRDGFDNTPNEERSKSELDKFWFKPFILSRDDGKFCVRCLDGGAWDRSTNYGIADSIEEAQALARTKLASWREMIDRPTPSMRHDGLFDLVCFNARPDEEPLVVARGLQQQELKKAVEDYLALHR